MLSAILSQLTNIEKAGIAATATQAELVIPYLRSYLNGILAENSPGKSGKVNQMLAQLDKNVPVTDALSILGLTIYISELKACQQSINESESQRREALSGRGDFNTADARAKIAYAISNLLNAIKLAKVEHTDIDYMPLINELNVLLSSRQSIVKSRTTRSKNSAANKTTTVASSTTTTATAI